MSSQVIAPDWVQKIRFENKVDLNLQAPSHEDSIKIEIEDLPNIQKGDTYLDSILSSSTNSTTTAIACTGDATCSCYKCQRHKRRAGLNRGIHPKNTPLSSTTAKMDSPKEIIAPLTPVQSPQPQKVNLPKRSSTIRKTPTLKSYEKHMPKPTYSQKDSIYRIEQETQVRKDQDVGSNKQQQPSEQTQDGYEMAWKEDGTGDDLLGSLVTFQTIFEEKSTENSEGLSDLLEQRAQELKYQKLKQQADALNPPVEKEVLPPKRPDCLTMSYRTGARHNPLTLYHTMKMSGEQERKSAYDVAFKHCINANSGLKSWMKRARVAPARENSKLIQPVRKATLKRSLLHPLASRKNKLTGEDMLIWSSSLENVSSMRSKKSIDMISAPIPIIPEEQDSVNTNATSQLTDVISVAQALLPNQNLNIQATSKSNKIPYDHIDTPSKPRYKTISTPSTPDLKDNSSISSSESNSGTSSKVKSRPARLFSSFGRKTSMRSHSGDSYGSTSIQSLEKIECAEEPTHESVLDDLCRLLPHIDRAKLSPYVTESNNDYLSALKLCKAAVVSGKLS